MAVSTVTHAPQHASSSQVKTKPGFCERLRERFRPDPLDEGPFLPNEHTRQVLQEVRALTLPPAAASIAPPLVKVTAIEGEITPDEIAANLIGVLAHGLKTKASPAEFKRLVAPHWEEIGRLAAAEEEFHETVTRRSQRTAARAEQFAGAYEVLGAAADTGAVARSMVQQSLHTTNPAEETGVIMMPKGVFDDPAGPPVPALPAHVLDEMDAAEQATVAFMASTAASSPVHVPGMAENSPVHLLDDTTPPVPGEDADPGDRALAAPLPHREPHAASFLVAHEEDGLILDGEQITALALLDRLARGPQWLASHGYWHLIKSAELVGEQVHIHLDSGAANECPHESAFVRVLDDDAARTLRDGATAPTVLPAAMSDLDEPVHGRPVDPALELAGGDWMFDEGSDSAGPVWLRVAPDGVDIDRDRKVTAVRCASGHKGEFEFGETVLVLTSTQAGQLLAAYRAGLAAVSR